MILMLIDLVSKHFFIISLHSHLCPVFLNCLIANLCIIYISSLCILFLMTILFFTSKMLIFIFYISFLFYLFHFITYIFINSIIFSSHSHLCPFKTSFMSSVFLIFRVYYLSVCILFYF